MKPKISPLNSKLYQAFKRGLRETKEWIVPKEVLIEELQLVAYEDDIGFYILKSVNDFYCTLQRDKLKRESLMSSNQSRANND